MRIALPTVNGQLCMHFGHCQQFALIDVDPAVNAITHERHVDAPPHQPGLLPAWLAEHDVTHVIAGGMGARAQGLFHSAGIDVTVGAPSGPPRDIVQAYIDGALEPGVNACDH
jgi:predicted Fe-Mo cluster-binding NifX family protein